MGIWTTVATRPLTHSVGEFATSTGVSNIFGDLARTLGQRDTPNSLIVKTTTLNCERLVQTTPKLQLLANASQGCEQLWSQIQAPPTYTDIRSAMLTAKKHHTPTLLCYSSTELLPSRSIGKSERGPSSRGFTSYPAVFHEASVSTTQKQARCTATMLRGTHLSGT